MAFRTFSIPNLTLTSHAHPFRLRVACTGFPEHIFTVDLTEGQTVLTEGQTVHVLSGIPWDASCALNRLCSNGATAKPSYFRAVLHDSSVSTTIVAISALPLLSTPPCFSNRHSILFADMRLAMHGNEQLSSLSIGQLSIECKRPKRQLSCPSLPHQFPPVRAQRQSLSGSRISPTRIILLAVQILLFLVCLWIAASALPLTQR